MKNKIVKYTIILMITLLINVESLYAWTGDTWGSISRETILRIADEMIDFSWTPKNTINNKTSNDYPIITYSAGTSYKGEAYTLYNTQNWAEFYIAANSTTGGTTSYGNDCSGFASISWKLRERYNTTAFECDAINGASSCGNYNPSTDDYVTKLGDTGSGPKVGLLLGDAFVKSGSHILLFEDYFYDAYGKKAGIKSMEQSTDPKKRAVRKDKYWTWELLSSYRPIRRNKIDEGNYVFKTKWGTGNGEFLPLDVAVDSLGNVYIVDQGNNRIQKFTDSGIFITKWGGLHYPYGIAVDSSNNVYVSVSQGRDPYNPNVLKFTNSGNLITSFTTLGAFNCSATNRDNAEVYGISISPSGDIYSTLSIHYSPSGPDYEGIRRFNSSGQLLNEWATRCEYFCEAALGKICEAKSIDLDNFENVYVADTLWNRIQKFTKTGSFITAWGNDGTFYQPYGLAVDLSGNVYVADTYNHRIQIFDSNGLYITKWGSNGTGNGQFKYPYGVAVDSSLNVYVADSYNNRIQKFAPVSKLPSAPSNLAALTVSLSQINLSWKDNSSNETGFKIKRKTGVNGTYTTIATVGANATNYTDTVSGSNIYYYSVWAYDSAGDSAYSDEVSTKMR